MSNNRAWRRARAVDDFYTAISGADFSKTDNRITGGIELSMSLRDASGVWHTTSREIAGSAIYGLGDLGILEEEFMAQLVIAMRHDLQQSILTGDVYHEQP